PRAAANRSCPAAAHQLYYIAERFVRQPATSPRPGRMEPVMSSVFSRRGGPRRPRPVAPPRVGHFYLSCHDGRLFCLNETARQLLREGLPVNPAALEQQPLLHLDGTMIQQTEIPLVAAWREAVAQEGTFLLPRAGYLPQFLTWSAAPMLGPGKEVA